MSVFVVKALKSFFKSFFELFKNWREIKILLKNSKNDHPFARNKSTNFINKRIQSPNWTKSLSFPQSIPCKWPQIFKRFEIWDPTQWYESEKDLVVWKEVVLLPILRWYIWDNQFQGCMNKSLNVLLRLLHPTHHHHPPPSSWSFWMKKLSLLLFCFANKKRNETTTTSSSHWRTTNQ